MARARDESTYWISYSDLSTGLLSVFILLVAVFINQAAKTQEALEEDQRRIDAIQQEISELLGRRDALARRLREASQRTNSALGRDVFAFDPETQQVVVQMDELEVAWFRPGSAKLAPQAQADVTTFYVHLYEHIMCARGDEPVGADPCSVREPEVPAFLDSIEILGHSDPRGRGQGQARWSWAAYNGTPGTGYTVDSNLQLAQERAKSIIDTVQQLYEGGTGQVSDATHPWRPFLALVRTSGRGWMSAFCEEERKLEPTDFLVNPPCVEPADRAQAERLEGQSRRVSFGFRLDDKEILERLQRLTREVAALGGGR